MADILSWDKAIDRKVKSSDNKDLGEVDSITKDYIQAKEGTISKNNYYIPKYYLQGYDGDNLWVSLTKDEVKARFERRDPPDPSEFETPEYSQRKSAVIQQYPDFANTIPMHSSSTPAATTTSQDMVGLPWEKVIDKKVKSSDNQDIGKVESISTYYTEVKDGRNHYYVPKHHIQGFDGHHLHASLTKDEIKEKYERDSPPSESEFKTQEYEEQMRKVESTYTQFRYGVPFMAKESGVALKSGSSGETLNIPWEEVIHKRVRTTDNIDIGDIETVGNEFIVVREGDVKIHHYYIPKSYISNYDGSSLWIDAPSGLLSGKFERESEPTPEELKSWLRNYQKAELLERHNRLVAMVLGMLWSIVVILVMLIAKTRDRSLSSPPIFILCDTCYWCATYFDNTRIPVDNNCPQCNANNNELTSFPIMSNESFTFDYNDKLGGELGFKPRRKDNNS